MTEEIFQKLLSKEVRETWRKWWELFNELLCHALTIIFVIGCIGAIHLFTLFANHGQPITLWDGTPVAFKFQHLLDAADAAMVICISVIAVHTIFMGRKQ